MDEGTEHVEELTLEPGDGRRSARPRALWAVLAAVAVAAGALVVTSAGQDGTTPAELPVALGSSIATRNAAGASADAMLAPVTYVAGDGLPTLGADAPAYRLSGTVTESQVRELAAALGLEGEVVHDGPGWTVTDGDATLQVYEGGAVQWWYGASGGGVVSSSGSGTSAGSAGCDGGPDCTTITTYCSTDANAPTSCTECPAGAACASVQTACDDTASDCTSIPTTSTIVCGPGADCVGPTTTIACGGPTVDCVAPSPPDCPVASDGSEPCPAPAPPVPAADLPSEDEARGIALDLLSATGVDVDGAVVTVDGPFDAWFVSVEPRVDGVLSGLYASVAVGPHGDIVSASGYLADPEHLGDYPVLDTRAAIDRANASSTVVPDTTIPAGANGVAEAVETRCTANLPKCSDTGSGTANAGDSVELTPGTVPPCAPQADGSEICQSVDSCVEGDSMSSTTVPCDSGGCPEGADPMGCVSTTVVDTVPVPDPGTLTITLVDAEPSLVLLGAIDGSTDAYLVPGYRFTDENGGRVDLPAVADSALTTPPTTDTSAVDPGDPPVTPTVEPQPCGQVLVEGDASGTTMTVQPNPCVLSDPQILGAGEQPKIGVAYYVDVNPVVHCNWVSVEFGGRWWWAVDIPTDDLQQWAQPTEGGTLTLTDEGHAQFVGDANGTKVATLVPFVGTAGVDRPLCE